MPRKLAFLDQGREPSHDYSVQEESEVRSNEEEMQIIEEEDSLEFDSQHRSKAESITQMQN